LTIKNEFDIKHFKMAFDNLILPSFSNIRCILSAEKSEKGILEKQNG